MSIGDEAFEACYNLREITIPDSIMSIGYMAFFDCTGLTEVLIPNSATSIGGGAFGGCKGLCLVISNDHSVYGFVDGVLFDKTKNMLNTYVDIKGLSSYIIPNFITHIGDNAFRGCSGLREMTISNSVTSIGGGAFADCSGLRVVAIPESVTNIEDEAFEKGIVIRGREGSLAHRYASGKDIYFEGDWGSNGNRLVRGVC